MNRYRHAVIIGILIVLAGVSAQAIDKNSYILNRTFHKRAIRTVRM